MAISFKMVNIKSFWGDIIRGQSQLPLCLLQLIKIKMWACATGNTAVPDVQHKAGRGSKARGGHAKGLV